MLSGRERIGIKRRLLPHALAVVVALQLTLPLPAVARSDDTTIQTKTLTALRINPHAPKIDGRLDDEIWAKAEFASSFTQKDPNEGEPAQDQTEVAVVYDDEAVYIGARMKSANPNDILATVSRRDNVSNSERIIVSLDTYHDRRTAYSFGVTASGVRVDYYHPGDSEGWRDYDFNPVWTAGAARTPDGWSAEMRIPFTQLRFNNTDEQVWGVNMNRWVPNINEDSYWILVPKDENGWSSRMGELVGIQGIKPSRRIELLPYVANDALFRNGVDPADPFNDDAEFKARFGGDFKMGIGPNLTLQGTVNPDFGQVEADPDQVNLSPFESVFQERRPFFTESSQKLKGGGARYFYSRRVGRPPQGGADGSFVERPSFTSILGAAKLTGRLSSGLSVGMLTAVTEREKAKTFDADSGQQSETEIEPLTGYGVLRLQQEFGKDQSTIGMILTGVERDVQSGEDLYESLRSRAISGGTDWNLRFKEGKYELGGNIGFSHVRGSQQSIENTQRSSARYFQRPDADYVELDTTRTSMSGFKGGLRFEKNSGKHWLWGGGFGTESPEFEINDAGQIGASDDIDSWSWVRYRENEPGKYFQSWWLSTSLGSGWNYGRDRQYSYFDLESVFTLKNFIGTFTGFEIFPRAQNDGLTRGGPSMGNGSSWNLWHEWWSNNKGRLSWNLWGGYSESETGSWSYNAGGRLGFKPGERWDISIAPNWNQQIDSRQFIGTEEGGPAESFDTRYIFAFAERSRLRATVRLNYSFTPDLSLELYAQPFSASVEYQDFGEMVAARSRDVRVYGTDGTSIQQKSDGVYEVTDGSDTFEIEANDFSRFSFRSNLVLRWEWSPGSTMFLVWQMNRGESEEHGGLARPSRLWDALTADGDNFLALKITYWVPFL